MCHLLQDVCNLLPNLSVDSLVRSFAIKSNDMMLVVYLSSMIRAVLALHNLIDNKEQRMWHEQQQKEGDGKALENGKLVRLASALRNGCAPSIVFVGQWA